MKTNNTVLLADAATTSTAEDNLDGLVDWFATEYRQLKTLFQPYLDAS